MAKKEKNLLWGWFFRRRGAFRDCCGVHDVFECG